MGNSVRQRVSDNLGLFSIRNIIYDSNSLRLAVTHNLATVVHFSGQAGRDREGIGSHSIRKQMCNVTLWKRLSPSLAAMRPARKYFGAHSRRVPFRRHINTRNPLLFHSGNVTHGGSFLALSKYSCGSIAPCFLPRARAHREKWRFLCILSGRAGFFVSFFLRRIDLCARKTLLPFVSQVSWRWLPNK